MDYIVSGEGRNMDNLLQEQRVRVAMGVVTITPAGAGAGYVPKAEADALRAERDGLKAQVSSLTAAAAAKDKEIAGLKKELDALKDPPATGGDSKTALPADSKAAGITDRKAPEA